MTTLLSFITNFTNSCWHNFLSFYSSASSNLTGITQSRWSQVPNVWSPQATNLRSGTKIGEVIFPISRRIFILLHLFLKVCKHTWYWERLLICSVHIPVFPCNHHIQRKIPAVSTIASRISPYFLLSLGRIDAIFTRKGISMY